MLTAEVFDSGDGGISIRIAHINGSRALFHYREATSLLDAADKCRQNKKFIRSYSGAIFCHEMDTDLCCRTAQTITDEIKPI
jgi:hypothetical protein